METFTARTPVDLLALVPFVIGFHPENSVVLLTMGAPPRRRSGRPGSFHARVDLPTGDAAQREVGRMLREVVAQHGVTLVGLVIYTDDVELARGFAELVVPGFLIDGVDVVDVLRADGGRWFAAEDPDDPGTPYDLSAHPFTVRSVLEGRVVHPSRTALRDSLIGADNDDAEQVSAAATTMIDGLVDRGAAGESLQRLLVDHAGWMEARIHEYVATRDPIEVGDAARLLVLVSFDALREVAWASMTRATAREHVELWRDLVRRAPDDLRSGACGLLAFAAWLAGDGALAWCAVDRCGETDPDDELAQQAADLVQSATPPGVWAPAPPSSLRLYTTLGGVRG